MVRPIMRDPLFLAGKSEPATEADRQIVQDLLDTLKANQDRCVGMAANMIGVKKNIIVVSVGIGQMAMINPQIVVKKKPYDTEEGCLSLTGVRKVTRYKNITVRWQTREMKEQVGMFAGFTALAVCAVIFVPLFTLYKACYFAKTSALVLPDVPAAEPEGEYDEKGRWYKYK